MGYAPSFKFPGGMVVPFSNNRKTGPVHLVYLSHHTCPDDCPFKYTKRGPGERPDGACYALVGRAGIHAMRLWQNVRDQGFDHLEMAHNAATAIRSLPATADLRLFAQGDFHCAECAEPICNACRDYLSRCGGKHAVYGYTHSRLPAALFEGMHILRSGEDISVAVQALDEGWSAAIVVPEYKNGHRAWKEETDAGPVTYIPCPYDTEQGQRKGVTCNSCRLCFDTPRLAANRMVIALGPAAGTEKRVHAMFDRKAAAQLIQLEVE